MSTTATVSVVEDGKVTMTHVYQNGFPEALGKKLKEDYGDLTKALEFAEGDKIVFDNIDAWKSVQPASEYNYVFVGGKWLLYSPAELVDLDCNLDKGKLREAAGAAVSAIGGEFSENQDAVRLRIQLDSSRFINFNLEDQILNYKIADDASLPYLALTGIIKGLEAYAIDRQCNFEESDVPTIAALSDLLFQVTGFDRAKYQDLTIKQNMMEYFIYRVCGEEGKDLAKALEQAKKGYAVKKIDKLADSLGLSLKKKIQELAGVDGWLYFSNVYAMVHQYRRNMRTFGKGWVDMLEEIKKDSHYQKAEELLAKEKEVVNRKFEGSLKQLQCVSVKDRKEKGKSIMNRALSAAAKAALAIALFGGASQTVVALPSAVLASKQYRVKVTKKTFVYNAKGKKTKKYYKKNASLKAFGTKTIKGKKYYILGKGRYIRTSGAKKAGETKYRYSTQTKKISRTIKMYTPKGVKKVIQKAYIKRTVKTNKKTGKKTYGKWSTAVWKKYKPVKFKGYTASKETVKASKVTSKTKNKTVKITYKLVKKTAPKKTNTKPAAKPSTTPAKPANSGSSSASSSNKPATKPSQPASTGGNSHSGNTTKPSQPTNSGSTGNTNGGSTNTGSTAPSQPTNGGASTNTPSQPTNSGNTGNSGNTTPNQPTNGGNSNTGNSGTTAPSQPTNSSNTGNTNSGSGSTAPSQPTNSGNTGSGSTAPSQPVSGNTGNANSSSGTTAPSQPASKPSQPTNSGSTNTGNSGNTGSGTTTPSQPTNGGSTNTGSTGNAGTSQPVQPQKPASGNTDNTGNTNSGSGSIAPSQPAEPVKTAPADKVTTASVAYRTVYQADPSMAAGTKKTLQAGQTGVDTTTTSYNVDGSVKSTSTVRTKNPVDQVIAVGTKSVVKTETVAYQTVKKNDDSLAKGATKVVTKGVNGSKTTTTTYSLNTQTGEVVASTSVKTVDPVNEVVAVGTKEVAKPIAPAIPSKAPEDKVTTAEVAYKTIYQADPAAEAGTKKTVTAGVNGVDTTTTTYNLDGSVKSTSTVRTKNPVDQLVAVGTKTKVSTEMIAYKYIEKADPTLAKGEEKLISAGHNGEKITTTTYTLDTATGLVTPNVDVKATNPVDAVLAVGTKEAEKPAEPTAPADKVTTAEVAYKTVYQADPSLDAGTKKTVTVGVKGVDTTTTSYNLDGSVKSTNTVRTKEAVNEVVAVGTKSVVKSEVLSYKTVEQSDNSLAKGTTKVVTKGVNGSKTTTTTYTLDTATGLVTPHVDVKTQNPVDEVVAVGTAVAPEDKVTTAAVAFKTIYQADPNAIAGSKKVVTAGVNGVDTTTTSYNLDGSVKSTNAVRTKNPVDQVVAVGTKATTTTEILPYSTVKKTDDSLAKDATKVLTKGVNGSKTTTTSYTLNTATGEVTAHTDVKTTDPVNEVVAVGTAVAPEDKVTTKDVAYKTVYTADDTMAAGTKKTVTAGQSGVDTTTTTYNLDGSVKATNTVRTKNPVDEVVAVGTKSVVKNEILSYKYVEKEDPTLAKGEEKLISVGYNGKKVTTTTYTLDTQTGEVTAHTDVKTTDPVDAVLAVGTKEAPTDLVTTAPVAYKTIYQANNDLAAGTKMVLTKGESGVDTTTTTYNLDGSVKSITTVHTKEAVSEVVAVGTKTEVSTEILQYKSVTKEDPTLKKGTTQKVKGGINGWATTTTTYTLDTATGEVTAHKSVEKVDPVDEVVAVGTAEANPYTAEKIAKLKPMLLALVNQYRAEVGADPLIMDSTYDSILDARAAQKAKDEGTTGTYNHSGFSDLPDALNKEEATDGYVHGGESLGVGQFSLYASDEDQFAGILNYEKMTEDDEKADYQAIVIDKSRDYFKGPSQTYRHYTMMVDKKNTKVYIGVGTYVDENEDGWISVVFEFKP